MLLVNVVKLIGLGEILQQCFQIGWLQWELQWEHSGDSGNTKLFQSCQQLPHKEVKLYMIKWLKLCKSGIMCCMSFLTYI